MIYSLEKLTARKDPYYKQPIIKNGAAACGELVVIDPNGTTHEERFSFNENSIRPGTMVAVNPYGDYGIRTSLIASVYQHNPIEGQDKLVLPKEFDIENLPELPKMNVGEFLILTLNSVYYLRKIEVK